ncbi:SOS response-associated peptidase [Ammonicoccus fulvus]|uniref:Abasic site processing protein n=1 Tax=Ammonicoccus fulvus TaxID=3138240 RepID=A0ABZ3FRD4_9ACTN
MCGRYAASADVDQLVEEFEIDEVTEAPEAPSWNLAPTDPVPAVVERLPKDAEPDAVAVRKLVQLRWGLVPSWSKDARGGARMINARFETVDTKPAYRKAFASRRCLLPADGYYEWYTQEGSKKKQPYFIHRGDGDLLVMAGIYEFWRDDSLPAGDPGAWVTSCSIITTSATDALGRIHDRMPMIIRREAWDAWLDPRQTDPDTARSLLGVTDAELLEAYAVGPAVGNVRADGPELVMQLPEAGA